MYMWMNSDISCMYTYFISGQIGIHSQEKFIYLQTIKFIEHRSIKYLTSTDIYVNIRKNSVPVWVYT